MISLIDNRLRWLFASAVLVALVASTAVACGDDDDDSAATSTATSAATTAASSTAQAAAYPMKVTDLLGREVEIKSKPATVVALSPSAVEYVYAVGGTVVGRPESAVYPEAVKSVKSTGTSYQPSFEEILQLKPDLVVADSVIHAQPQLRSAIEGLGIPVIFAGAETYAQVLQGVELLGKVLDANGKATETVTRIKAAHDAAKAAVGTTSVSAVVLIAGRDNTLFAAKKTSYPGDILTELGVANPAADGPEAGQGFPGYTLLAPESLVQYDPDVIFTLTPGPASVPRLSTLIPTIPPFKSLKAVTTNKVIEIPVDIVLEAPGPRVELAFLAVTAAVK
ncbi:MAG: ABC transporter substrate-binding protein [Dehalococcoidia bacterium]|nr:ABC transporter substrate-binding protein [Thermoflexaceae bacterium]